MSVRCRVCRSVVPRAATGRPRQYCTDACRQLAYRKRGKRRVIFSSRSDEWSTDPGVFARLNTRYGPFDLDVCATDENAKCPRFFTRSDDGLAQAWVGRVWCNPPYGRQLGAWVAKAYESAQTTADVVVLLLPVRSDTAWWHDFVERGEVELLRGRLKFGGAKNSAPFPSAVVVFRNAALRNETLPGQLCADAGEVGR